LAKVYPAAAEPAGTKLTQQVVKVGSVRWRWSMTVVLGPQGLYLKPELRLGLPWFFGAYPPLLIPWAQFKSPRKGRIYIGWQAVELSIGDPQVSTITFPLDLYRRISVFLSPSVAASYPVN
jgi:hypothetical protein